MPILLCLQWTFEHDMEGVCPKRGNRLLLSIVHSEESGWKMLKFWLNLLCTSIAEKMGGAAPQLYYGIVMTGIKNKWEVWRHVIMVAKFLDLDNLSWQRWPFALSNDKRNVWATVLSLTVIMHIKVIHDSFFFVLFCLFFLPYLQDHEILLPWQLNVTSLLYFVRGGRDPFGWLECVFLSFSKRAKGIRDRWCVNATASK